MQGYQVNNRKGKKGVSKEHNAHAKHIKMKASISTSPPGH